jgi:PKD repeat protein
MNRKLLIASVFAIGFSVAARAAFVPVPISAGFNADVIVNGVGTSMSTTSNDVDGVNYCFVANGWQFSTSNTPFAGGLPPTGLITSPITTGLTYQLASYSDNNCLRINSATPATLTMQNQLTAQGVYVLSTSGSGNCVMSAQVNFTDATNQVFTNLTVNDWYGGTPYEIGQIGRILRNGTSTVPESATNGPRLYRHVLAISTANQTKQIASIQFTRTSGTGILNVYAVSYETTVSCAAPTAPNATAVTATSALLNWTQAGTPVTYQIKYGPSPFNPATAGNSLFTTTKPYSLNPPLNPSTTYEYYVRAVCGPNDTSLWSPATIFTTLCSAPSIVSKKDSSRCGPGIVVLQGSVSAGNAVWYQNATGGTPLHTGTTYTTPSITATTTYYLAASASATCESPRQAVVATIKAIPTVNLGNDTTICPGITYTLNAGNPGGTYAWNTGATSQTITVNDAGTYSLMVTAANGCINSDAITITQGIVPINVLPAVTNLCSLETATLNAGNVGSTFVWTPTSATTQQINVTTGGTYSVAVKSINGCVVNCATDVIIRPLPVPNLGNDTSICQGDQIVLDAGNPGHTYDWSTGAATQTINAADSGTYSVIVTTSYNCVDTEDKHIAFLPSPRVEGFNFIPLFYEDLGKVRFSPLNPTAVVSYEWDFGDGSATSTAVNPTHIYAAGGMYNVTLKVYNGCDDYDITLPINVDLVTGIATLGKDAVDMTLYPNPASGMVTIENKSSNVKMEQVTIYNTVGAAVYTQKAGSADKHTMSVSGLASGLYSIRILTDKGFVVRKLEVLR